jgi:hypothetical protein
LHRPDHGDRHNSAARRAAENGGFSAQCCNAAERNENGLSNSISGSVSRPSLMPPLGRGMPVRCNAASGLGPRRCRTGVL